MRKQRLGTLLLLAFTMAMVVGCKKKNDPREMVYKTWKVESFSEDEPMDEAGKAELMKMDNWITFDKNGKLTAQLMGDPVNGTFTLNETATSMVTTVNDNTTTLAIEGLTATTMTLNDDGEKMVLSVKK